jgi:hypothetical protein
MSEIKVNKIQPAAGSQITVQAQVLGVPGTDPNHFATVSQLGGGGAGGISRAEAQELVDSGVAAANRHSDEQDALQNTQINLDITIAKQEAVSLSKDYTDSVVVGIGSQGSSFSIVEMPNWTYQTTWENDAGQTGLRTKYNRIDTNGIDGLPTNKFQIAGINGISVTGATGYESLINGKGQSELVPYQRVIVDGSGAKVPSWTSETDLGIGSILVVRSATVNGNSDYSYNVGSSINGVIRYSGSGRYVYNGSVGTLIQGTWRVLCWSSDDSGNPSSQFLAQRIS